MANVSLVREAIVVISKETGGWLFSKRVYIITKSVKMNLIQSNRLQHQKNFKNNKALFKENSIT